MKVATLVALTCAWGAIALPSEGDYRLVRDWPRLPDGVGFGEVSGLDVDSHGHVFVFHRAGRGWEPDAAEPIAEPTVFEIDGDTGTLLGSWGAGTFLLPHGLTVDHEDHIWLTDVALHQVFQFSHDGELLLELGTAREPGWNAEHFDRPTDVAVSRDGSFYVSDGYGNSRVARFSAEGRFLYEWGRKGSGNGELDIPHGIALLPDGNVLVADRENARIQVFDPRGRFVHAWSTSLGRVFSVSVGLDGAVYAGIRREDHVPDSNGVVKLDGSSGWTELERIGFSDDGEAVFHAVHDAAVGPSGAIYVGETRTRTVRKLAPHQGSSFVDLLARTNAKIEQFQFSPDGKQIAYLSAAHGDHHICHAARVSTPLLFLHARGDPAARFQQIEQYGMQAALHGNWIDWVVYGEEPHGWYHGRPDSVEKSLRLMDRLFDRFILGNDHDVEALAKELRRGIRVRRNPTIDLWSSLTNGRPRP